MSLARHPFFLPCASWILSLSLSFVYSLARLTNQVFVTPIGLDCIFPFVHLCVRSHTVGRCATLNNFNLEFWWLTRKTYAHFPPLRVSPGTGMFAHVDSIVSPKNTILLKGRVASLFVHCFLLCSFWLHVYFRSVSETDRVVSDGAWMGGDLPSVDRRSS